LKCENILILEFVNKSIVQFGHSSDGIQRLKEAKSFSLSDYQQPLKTLNELAINFPVDLDRIFNDSNISKLLLSSSLQPF
jgi:hypothetical protein